MKIQISYIPGEKKTADAVEAALRKELPDAVDNVRIIRIPAAPPKSTTPPDKGGVFLEWGKENQRSKFSWKSLAILLKMM